MALLHPWLKVSVRDARIFVKTGQVLIVIVP